MLRLIVAVAFLSITLTGVSSALDDGLREHVEIIESNSHVFHIDVGGTIDPENLEVTIENLGSAPVVDPRITVNDRYDWYTLDSLVKEITRGCRTDREKAMAIFRFVDKETAVAVL